MVCGGSCSGAVGQGGVARNEAQEEDIAADVGPLADDTRGSEWKRPGVGSMGLMGAMVQSVTMVACVLWGSTGFHGVPWHPMGPKYQGVPWDSMGSHGVPWAPWSA